MNVPVKLRGVLERATRRSRLLRLALFVRESGKLWRAEPQTLDLKELLRLYPRWQSSQRPGQSALADARPWITFGAFESLERIVRADMRVFEYGAGGSTLYFADRVAEGVTVEHDAAWSADVQRALLARGHRGWRLELHPPVAEAGASGRSPAALDGYVSDGVEYAGQSFRDYAASIDRFADGWFDLVLVDGRARPSCFHHAVRKVKTGGFLVLDNSERPYYRVIHEALDTPDWERREHQGPGPYSWGFWATTFWRRLR
jgi:hypothetical protein